MNYSGSGWLLLGWLTSNYKAISVQLQLPTGTGLSKKVIVSSVGSLVLFAFYLLSCNRDVEESQSRC